MCFASSSFSLGSCTGVSYRLVLFALANRYGGAARIAWLLRLVVARRKVHVTFACAEGAGRSKVKITMQPPSAGNIDPAAGSLVTSALGHLQTCLQDYVTVDRGHRHSSFVTHVTVWLTPKPTQDPLEDAQVGDVIVDGGARTGIDADEAHTDFDGDGHIASTVANDSATDVDVATPDASMVPRTRLESAVGTVDAVAAVYEPIEVPLRMVEGDTVWEVEIPTVSVERPINVVNTFVAVYSTADMADNSGVTDQLRTFMRSVQQLLQAIQESKVYSRMSFRRRETLPPRVLRR